jgi:alkanesulfonate monooxygenase SsuD/methylene tetrahydromethanopterin reductase-like flavin-dependent oxidoreductase (luciferase family)
LAQVLQCSAIGSPETVKRSIEAFIARTGADELILASHIYDHAARVRAYEITATVCLGE